MQELRKTESTLRAERDQWRDQATANKHEVEKLRSTKVHVEYFKHLNIDGVSVVCICGLAINNQNAVDLNCVYW